ncbi:MULTISPECIES: ABC transporter transmembrane domain-containing protein [unclassified Iodidimonas]|jgi:ATP-binding cassette subfamily B protein|uniref:ABC transporter transmembrane domain-containing protein n=1 Tax=unclassified Iodidimonas TaxID=2626145 RepID=UPI002482B37E|nr:MULTISPECIES: ABC transporter transmembrane domain-containing protein [unclassified Iodidimonas]
MTAAAPEQNEQNGQAELPGFKSDGPKSNEDGRLKGLAGLARLKLVAGYVLRYKKLAAMALLSLSIAAAANLAVIGALQPVIDKGFNADDPAAIDRSFAILFGIVVILALAASARAYFVTLLGERVVADLRRAAHARVVSLHPSFFEENRPSEIVSRLTADAGVIQQVVSTSVSIALRNSALFIGGLSMMVIYNPGLMAIITVAIPLIIAPILYLGRKVRALSRSSQDRIADVATMATESLGAIQVVQAFTREGAEKNRFRDAVERAYETAQRRIMARSVLAGVVIFLISAAITFILWQGAHEVVAGHMTGGEMAAFVGYAIMAAAAAGAVVEVYSDLQRAAGAAGRLGELLEARSAIIVPDNPIALPHPLKGRLAFENVSFFYPSKPAIAALQEISFVVEPGQTVALVGPSGAGKSTILQLLMRFFDPQSGRVLLDDVDISQTDPVELRQHLAIVPQDTVIFADTVRENIRYGRIDADDAAVEAAAMAAMADGFIKDLPGGYESWLGERGVRLSGGQRQRLAIARAILRDAPILLLDEATSALDAEAERTVQGALEYLMQGRTSLVIAHRLSTVLKADRILVMDEGRLIASGTHAELLASNPLYARLAKLQFDLEETGPDPLLPQDRKLDLNAG